jgi:phosphoesterase RecJ-like protein
LTHRRPDGDTVGSAAALCLGLRQLGKNAWVLENPEVTDRFAFLLEGLTKEAAEETDTVVSVDVASPGMLPGNAPQREIALRIDHHGSGREYTPTEYVDSQAAACAEMIWELLLDMGVEPDEKIAEAVYVGVSTDTGRFLYANTTSHTFDVAGDCAHFGADVFEWNRKIFDTNSLAKLKLHAWVVDHLQFLCNGEIVMCALPASVEEELGVGEDDLNNLSGFLRSIEGVRVAALLRNAGENNTKVSVRSIPGYNAASICELFGGGGHAGAAGCSIRMSLHQAENAMIEALSKWCRT